MPRVKTLKKDKPAPEGFVNAKRLIREISDRLRKDELTGIMFTVPVFCEDDADPEENSTVTGTWECTVRVNNRDSRVIEQSQEAAVICLVSDLVHRLALEVQQTNRLRESLTEFLTSPGLSDT